MTNKLKNTQVYDLLTYDTELSSSSIMMASEPVISYSTLKRRLADWVEEGELERKGTGRATTYKLSSTAQLNKPFDFADYFSRGPEKRKAKSGFDFSLFEKIEASESVFTKSERIKLRELQSVFKSKMDSLPPFLRQQEIERLSIDFSWKSAQIEGNTYSLIDTEVLLKEEITAAGKTRQEATMLLNHKKALDFIFEDDSFLEKIAVPRIEHIHQLLIDGLEIPSGVRNRVVGIGGSVYRPLDNEFQIQDALFETCRLINKRPSPFEKSFLALLLLSYIQPFMDGNKRTARTISNALLSAHHCCPISYRTVEVADYKKATILFYEQLSMRALKEIFIEQYEFAVHEYF